MFGDNLKTFADYSQAKVLNAQSRDNTPLGPRERYSFSRLAYFLQCPVRYKYAVTYGMQTPLPDPADFGANVHRALEVLHERARTRQAVYEDDIAGIIHETWQRNPLADEKQDEAAQRAAVEQLKRYVSSHAADLARVDRAEAEFAFQLQAKVLLGKIDLIRRDADVASDLVEIVDFKTSKSLPVELEQIDTQMDLYALGAEAHFGVKVGRQIVHFLGDDRVQSWKWSEERRELAQSKLTDTMANIAGSNFEPRTSYCVRCAEFRIICPYASKPLVAAQNPQKRRRSS